MIIQGVALNGVTVVDLGPVTSNLVLYYNPADTSSYSGTGTTVNSLVSPNLAGTTGNRISHKGWRIVSKILYDDTCL